jgi:hypothetical protein
MNIADQIALFYERFGEPAANSKITTASALLRINLSRRNLATKIKFYDVKDSVTAAGSETYWTLRDDFLGLYLKAKDCVTYDGYPVTLKGLAEWASIKSGNVNIISNSTRLGMLHGRTFYIHPAAEAGKVVEWWGYGVPPELPAVTGPDAYLTDEQAELTVLDAVIKAKADSGDAISQILMDDFKELRTEIKKKAQPMGPRLEDAPGY